ncbi:MAG: hypothetical protein ACI9JM_000385 [Halioglobus sp.]|jgi:hypothetical protein
MSFPKEPGYLAFGDDGYTYPDGYGRPAPASTYVVNSEASYLNLFATATDKQHLRGDASTWYLAKEGVAEKIHAYSPDAKIIVVFRHPADRAYSAWCHARRDQLEPCDNFADALEQEADRGEVEYLLRYRSMGLYSAALQKYLSIFPASQVLVLFYDDLRANPSGLWQQVCAFLDIDASQAPMFERKYNRSGQPRSRAIQRVLRSHQVKSFIKALKLHRQALWFKQRIDDVNLQKFPPLDDQTRAQLLAYYKEDINVLSDLTGRDLEHWMQ